MRDNNHQLDVESKFSKLNIEIFSSSSTQKCGTLNTSNMKLIPGSNIDVYNEINGKVRLSTFHDI